jgi:uncharacterized membrane protein
MRYDLWGLAAVATAIVAFVVHRMATPIPGVGISVPTFAPPLLAAGAALGYRGGSRRRLPISAAASAC